MAEIVFYGKSIVGNKRTKNEDSYFISPGLKFCAVADGIGGAAAGELASKFFVKSAWETFSKGIPNTEEKIADTIRKIYLLANEKILDHIKQKPLHDGMGCTAELLVFLKNSYILGHIGDSRTYRLKNGKLSQITHDHSLVQSLLDEKLISDEQAKKHQLRHVILRSIGTKDKMMVDIIKGVTAPGDIFLLCSDGLTDMVEDKKIEEIMSLSISLAQKTETLIELAMRAGGNDNITVVLSETIE